MGLFNIVYSNLPANLLPVRLRKPVHRAWLQALVNGAVVPLYNTFFANREANVYYLRHNGQVCYLEAALNDAFDPASRLIYISNPTYILPIYVYLAAEHLDVFIATETEIGAGTVTAYTAPVFLYTETEMGAALAGFIVYVPTALGVFSDPNLYNRIRALVDKYRLPSKSNWSIAAF